MKTKYFLPILALLSLLCSSAFVSAAEKDLLKAFRVKGEVYIIDQQTGSKQPLANGVTFKQGNSIMTGDESSVMLLLSNGSSVAVSANSLLDVNRFTQEPFESKRSFDRLRRDPSVSDASFFLQHGEVIARTKRLKEGSRFQIDTLAGKTRVKGSTVRVTFERVNGVMTVSNLSGDIDAQSAQDAADAWAAVTEGTLTKFTIELDEAGKVVRVDVLTDVPVDPDDIIAALGDLDLDLSDPDDDGTPDVELSIIEISDPDEE